MLKRTKDSSAAHGVLAIFLLLLSASQGIPVVVEEEEEVTTQQTIETTAATEGSGSITVRNFAFKSFIEKPCPSGPSDTAASSREAITEVERREYYKAISSHSADYRSVAQQMLNQSVDCASLHMSLLPKTPTLEELQAMNASEALRVIYASVLRHTAHAYFVHSQQQTYANTMCSNASVSQKWVELSVKQKFLACLILQLSTADMGSTNYINNVTQTVLDESLSDVQICARRRNRDCQVLKSTIYILDVVSNVTQTAAAR